jgi:hypothetical protein
VPWLLAIALLGAQARAGRRTSSAESPPGIARALPPHWAPADPEQRRAFEHELRRALQPPGIEANPEDRRRLDALRRAALTPPAEAYRTLARIEQERDQNRGANSVPPPTDARNA